MYLRFIKVNFSFTKGEGKRKNCHFRLWSTTSGPHFDPHDTHSLRHMTQMNELKRGKNLPEIIFKLLGRYVRSSRLCTQFKKLRIRSQKAFAKKEPENRCE